MGKIKCNECNKEISDEMKYCPNCGKEISDKKDNNNKKEIEDSNSKQNNFKNQNNKKRNIILLFIFVTIILTSFFYLKNKKEELFLNLKNDLKIHKVINNKDMNLYIEKYGNDKDFQKIKKWNEKLIKIYDEISSINNNGFYYQDTKLNSLRLEIDNYLNLYSKDKKMNNIKKELEKFISVYELYENKKYSATKNGIIEMKNFKYLDIYSICNEQFISSMKLKPLEKEAIEKIKALKLMMKNPESVTIKSIQYSRVKDTFIDYLEKEKTELYFDITAKNGFGVNNRMVYLIENYIKKNSKYYYTNFDIEFGFKSIIHEDTYFIDNYVVNKRGSGFTFDDPADDIEYIKLDLEKILWHYK
mgnify:CR=1 FL=1